ncbi:MAG: SLC13 family permease [Planctomycetaceae bacterium]|nr:SLC13 family permease [Planctomycetaceae bacterium]
MCDSQRFRLQFFHTAREGPIFDCTQMTFELVATLIVLALILVGLMQESIGAEMVMLSGLTVLVALGVIDIDDALVGFANPSVIIIGALFVVGTGLRSTGALETVSRIMFGKPAPGDKPIRFLAPIAALSAFMNNTPLVAFFLPVFIQLAKRVRVSPSKLLIPLSYASILGGVCTLVGTSTNLVVAGLLKDLSPEWGGGEMTMFELTWVGVPVCIVGLIYLVTVGIRWLPDRQDLMEYMESHPREYSVEMMVGASYPFSGKTIRSAGLRDLPGLYLYRIERDDLTISAVGPDEVLRVGDILCFSGIPGNIVDLQKIRGFDPVEHRTAPVPRPPVVEVSGNVSTLASLDSLEGLPVSDLSAKPAPRVGRQLCEVVISSTSPLQDQSIKDTDFRTRYDAAIIAVHRSGEKLQQKIGQIVLRAGDTLLIDADETFVRRWRHSPDFILVSGVEDSAPLHHERAWIALTVFAAVVIGMSLASFVDWVDQTLVAMAGAALMVLTRCIRSQEARRAVDISVLVLVAASLGIGSAMHASHADQWLAEGLISACHGASPVVVMAVIYVLTVILSELLSNTATAALMGGLAISTSQVLGVNARPMLIAVAIAASCAFATPIGYQTNLMVLNPGGYRFRDYIKVGLPLDCLCGIVSIIVIPLRWEF